MITSSDVEYKIFVLNESAGREIQQLFFQLGYGWIVSGKEYLIVEESYIYAKDDFLTFSSSSTSGKDSYNSVKLTIPELKDIVLIHCNSIEDATHEDQDEERWLKLSDGTWLKWLDSPYHGRPRWFEVPSLDPKTILKLVYEKEIESLKAQLAQYQSDDWVSVEDRLPENGQDVFAVDSITTCQFRENEFLEEFYEFDTGHNYEEAVDIKYWKPMIKAQEQDSE